jgi:hypothetical protein
MPASLFKYFKNSTLFLIALALLPAFLSLAGLRLDRKRQVRYKMCQDFLCLLNALRSM